ncbi:MAG: hypothetical protein M1827_002015 [Pycnora praestabilis]|nr:MAG: hypothetical protein M1827_002015 [Pycnora praestabilis]
MRMTRIAEECGFFDEKVDWSKKPSKMEEDVEQHGDQEEDDDRYERTRHANWLSLFNFTTKKHAIPLTCAIILSIASGIIVPALAIFLGKVFDSFTSYGGATLSGSGLVRKVSIDCLALVGLGSASWLLNGGYYMFWLVFGELQAKSVRDRLFDDLLEKDMEWYDMRKSGIGALIPRMQTQIRELQLATSQPLGFLCQYVVTMLAALGLAFYSAWSLTLVTLATVPFSAVILSVISAKMQPSIEAQEEKLTEASKIANNGISSIDTVKCFNGQDFEIWQYASVIKKAARCYLIQAHANALQIGFVRIITLGMFVQGFWYGSTLIHPGGKSAGQVLTTFWSCLMATQAIEQILPQMIVLEKGRAAGATLKAILDQVKMGRKITRMRGKRNPQFCEGDVEVRNVSFAYPARPDKMALSNANFFFGAGETTFVVGRSGSGKSTLGNLLMLYYTAGLGDISIDGNSLQTLDLHWIRNNITLVQQQSVLFNETIFKNIAFGRRDHDNVRKEEVREAVQVALLQATINDLPEGLDTLIGASGNSMSGGQKQRVALARARLRDTPILILDEATSALDYISRSLVMDAIREWRKGKTTIIITHDTSQIFEDDFVYVLESGRVVQEGFKSALEGNRNGLFASLLVAGGDQMILSHAEDEAEISYSRPIQRSQSEGSIATSQRRSLISQDSLDLIYTERAQYVPVMFAMESMDTGLGRTPSLSLMSPLSPPKIQGRPASAEWRASTGPTVVKSSVTPLTSTIMLPPQGLELLELTGQRTVLNRVKTATPRRRRSAPSSAVPTPGSSAKPLLSSRPTFRRRKKKLSKAEKDRRIKSLKKILSTLWPNMNWQTRMILILGFICATIHAAATPTFSWVFAKLLATFYLSSGRSNGALTWSLAVLGVAIGDSLASYGMHYLLEYCGQSWIDTLRIQALQRVMDQPRSWFDRDKNSLSRIVESLDRNAEEMRNLVGRFAGFVFVAIIMTSIAVIWSFAVCWKLTFVGIASGPFMYGITRGFEAASGKWEGKSNDAAEVAGSIFTETFTSIRTVRALTLEGYFRRKYGKATQNALKVGLMRSAYSGLFFGLSDSGIIFVTALIFWYGAVLACSNHFSTEDIITVFTMLLFSIANANAIIAFIPQINSSRDTASRLLRLSSLPLHASHEHTGEQRIGTVGKITFNNLNFTYPSRPDQRVLHSLNLKISPNTCTAIVGSSGSGKSTIASLLLGLYPPDPTSKDTTNAPPSLTIAGRDIRRIHTATLRSLIAIVPQSPTLFSASIAENIAYGLPEASPFNTLGNVRAAAQAAGIDDFITSLPRGYYTPVGEGGMGLSGGQAQRLAVARALVRRPKVLILDEATSALDMESAEVVRKSVRSLVGREGGTGMTVLIITHSREMMMVAENIVVLDRGRVVEEGSFDDLMRKRGEFARLLSGGEWTGRE